MIVSVLSNISSSSTLIDQETQNTEAIKTAYCQYNVNFDCKGYKRKGRYIVVKCQKGVVSTSLHIKTLLKNPRPRHWHQVSRPRARPCI